MKHFCLIAYIVMIGKKSVITSFALLVVALIFRECRKHNFSHPNAGLNVTQLIRKYGYSVETHKVVTEDGYVLALHRALPKSKYRKGPVLLMHGMLQSSASFVTSGPGKALGLILADEGYDVWLGNSRGTTWSRDHKTFNPDVDNEFWNFTMHEIGIYDVPALTDYILKRTGEKRLQYVGYSQGSFVFFVLLSEKPEYVEKIKFMTALAPAIYFQNSPSAFLKFLLRSRKLLEFLAEQFNVREIFSQKGPLSFYLKQICHEHSIFIDFCLHHFFAMQGYNEEQFNKEELSLTMFNFPAGICIRQVFHVLQLAEAGEFRQYDYGREINLKKYGQEEVPKYNLSNVKAPVALYFSENDWVIDIKNIKRVKEVLPNVVKEYLVPLVKFNHNDFLLGKDVDKLLYKSVVEEMNKH